MYTRHIGGIIGLKSAPGVFPPSSGPAMTGAGPPPGALDLAAVMRRVSEAAAPFESRWTLIALQRIDPDIHERLVEQQSLYHQALITGDFSDVEEQAAAMCRSWVAVARTMEAAAVPDDAYLLGFHAGTRIAIGEQRHAIARVRELHGAPVIWITPDEVAALVAGLEAIKPRRTPRRPTRTSRRHAMEARGWLMSRGSFFHRVCDLAGLDPVMVRASAAVAIAPCDWALGEVVRQSVQPSLQNQGGGEEFFHPILVGGGDTGSPNPLKNGSFLANNQ